MPMSVNDVATGGEVHANPFIGPINHSATVRVTPADFTTAEVDSKGYLKPGVPLAKDGTMINAYAAGPPVVPADYVYGVTIEAVKIANSNSVADLGAAPAVDVAVAVIGAVNRAIVEDNLGRVLTAAEVDGFTGASGDVGSAGSKVALIS